MKLPIQYRLYDGYLWARIGRTESWQKIIRESAKIATPITQNFGNDFVYNLNSPVGWKGRYFYKDIIGGLNGHNGIDMDAPVGTCLYAPEDGVITVVKTGNDGCKEIRLLGEYEHVFLHLEDFNTVVGKQVKQGDLIGWCDNTGQFTTGSHLHWGVRPLSPDRNNGYAGYIDQRDFTDFNIHKFPYKDGMFLQRTDVKNGGHGEVYEVVDGQLEWLDSDKNAITRQITLVNRILKLMNDGLQPKMLTGITEEEFKKYNYLIK